MEERLAGPGARWDACPQAEIGFLLEPSPDLRRLLMRAGARASDDGRTEISIADIEHALEHHRPPAEPPSAATG